MDGLEHDPFFFFRKPLSPPLFVLKVLSKVVRWLVLPIQSQLLVPLQLLTLCLISKHL